ncbi:MAG TPA: IclR family transcriptional regulator C-terminal domain-containing protein [Stellaceae bacterium]
MSSLKKMIAALELVTDAKTSWTPEEIAKALKVSLPTAYRYVRELYGAGLFARLGGGSYTLGPRIVTLDYQMRRTDPLERVGRDLLHRLAQETGLIVLVSYWLNEQVLNVYEQNPVYGQNQEGIGDPRYGRGQITSLFRSSTARIVLAYQKPARQKRVFDRHAGDPDRDLLGQDWPSFRRALNEIKRQGTSRTEALLVPDQIGLAAPLLNPDGTAQGSITVVGPARRIELFDEAALRHRLLETARELTRRLAGAQRSEPKVAQRPAPKAAPRSPLKKPPARRRFAKSKNLR